MPLMNTKYSYGAMAVTLHWLVFFLVVGALASGNYFAHLAQAEKSEVVFIIVNHKTAGVAIFLIMLFRLLWKLINASVEPAGDHTPSLLAKLLTFIVHWGLYVALIGQAVIGLMMSHAAGREVLFFGWEFPTDFLAQFLPEQSARQWRDLHHWGGVILLVLIGLHLLGAIWSGLQNSDNLKRMWYGYRIRS